MTTTRTISLAGARGGHGTTTVAAALALFAAGHRPTALVSSESTAAAALLGVPLPMNGDPAQLAPNLVLAADPTVLSEDSPEIIVVDAGIACEAAAALVADEHYVVLRGPCYVALASLLAASADRPDGIILLVEPKRSLTARDVTDVLDVPVIATIDVTPDVARTIDAGLLVSRLHRLRECLHISSTYGRGAESATRLTARAPSASLSLCDNDNSVCVLKGLLSP